MVMYDNKYYPFDNRFNGTCCILNSGGTYLVLSFHMNHSNVHHPHEKTDSLVVVLLTPVVIPAHPPIQWSVIEECK